MQLALEMENLKHWKTQLTSKREGLLPKETGSQTKDIHFCSLKTQIHISQNLKVCFTPMVWLSHSFSFLPIIKHCVKLVTNESGNDLKVGEKIILHLCDCAFRLMNMTFKDTWCTQRDLNKSERLRWDQHKTSWVTFPKVKDKIIRQPPTRSFETVAQPDRSCLPLAFSEDRLPWLPAVQKSWRQWTWMGTHYAPLNKRDLMFIFGSACSWPLFLRSFYTAL